MQCQFFLVLVVLVAIRTAAPLSAETQAPAAGGPESVFKIGDVLYSLPFSLPSRDEIMRAAPAKDLAKDARIQCELLRIQPSAIRLYPMVGQASLVQMRFRCTVSAAGKEDMFYIDRNQLIPQK